MTTNNSLTAFGNSLLSQHSIDGLDTAVWLRWGVALFLLMLLAFWHHQQNRHLARQRTQGKAHSAAIKPFSQAASSRAWQAIFLGLAILLTLVFYDTRIQALENQRFALRTELADTQQVVDAYEADIAITRVELDRALQLAGMDESQQGQLDALKTRYENLYTSFFVLQRCNMSAPHDFHIINSAMLGELQQLNAPAATWQNTMQAARGTHDELYATLECNSNEVAQMATNIRNALDAVTNSTGGNQS